MLKWCILEIKCKKIKACKKNLSTEGNLVYEEQEIYTIEILDITLIPVTV